MSNSVRNSALYVKHKELGSTLEGDTWNNMLIPWRYNSDPYDDVIAVRTRAGLYDITALNIVNVTGPSALKVLDKLVAVDVTRLEPGTSRLAAEVNEQGALVDDVMIICDAKDSYRVSHGGGITQQTLAKLAEGEDVKIEQDFDVHMLSLQGPRSIDILNPHLDFDLSKLAYFKHVETTLFGRNVVISRGGYSGELGYEIACKSADAAYLWDTVLEKGQPFGAIPACWESLEISRIEAGLLFFPYEMPEGDTTPWEVNMGWCVDLDKKGDYIGKQAVLNLKGRERVKQAGLECHSSEAVEAGSKILKDGKEVGVVTSTIFSRYLMKSIALVHLKPEFSQIGTQVVVQGAKEVKAQVVNTPFYDPMRLRTYPEK